MVRIFSIFLLCFCCCSACATSPKKTTETTERFVWPPPPDIARIEWLSTYTSQLDIEKTPMQRFWAAIAGDDNAKSLSKPVDIKSVSEQNKFFVSDIGLAAVVVFDLANHEVRTLGNSALPLPLSVVLDGDGFIYVLERRLSTIHVFDRNEKFQRKISLKSLSVKSPTSMVIDKKNSLIYVSDAATRRIVVIDLFGGLVRSIGGSGEDNIQFNLPVAMALNSKGNLVVADAFSAKIQIFDVNGRPISKFGRRGDSPGDFQLIKSLAIDSSDNIYVVDGRAHNISIFNEHGDLLLVVGGFYSTSESGKLAPGGFSVPIGIDIDSTDKIYVVDQMNARVQIFQYYSEEYLLRSQTP